MAIGRKIGRYRDEWDNFGANRIHDIKNDTSSVSANAFSPAVYDSQAQAAN